MNVKDLINELMELGTQKEVYIRIWKGQSFTDYPISKVTVNRNVFITFEDGNKSASS